MLAWGWLLDADNVTNTQGTAAAWALAGTAGLSLVLVRYQRWLTSAYAWLQWMPPVIGFSLAAWAGRPLRFSERRRVRSPNP